MKLILPQTGNWLGALVACFGLAGCGGKPEAPASGGPALPVVQVRVQAAENAEREIQEEVVGTLRAKLRATLEARLSGRVEELVVVLGARVKRGDLIARLDAAEVEARLEQAQGSLELVERDWKRSAALYEQQSATRADYDAAQGRLRVARANVAEAKAIIGYVRIVAPFDGVVTRKWVDAGDLAAPGKPLVEIEDPSALQLEASLPESVAPSVTNLSRLAFRVDALPGANLSAVVTEMAPAADPLSRTVRVRLDVPSTPGLVSGQFARLAVPVGRKKSIRVPVGAVVERGQLELVFSVSGERARLHLVKTGKRLGDEVEILSGLEGGEAVVINGAHQLTEGQPVEVK